MMPLMAAMGYEPKEKVPKVKPVSQDALDAAYCPKAKNKIHFWLIGPHPQQLHRCKHCKATKSYYEKEANDFTSEDTPQKRWKTQPKTVILQDILIGLKVGESAQADHTHVVCGWKPSGGARNCGLLNTIKTMQRRRYKDRAWTWKHTAPHIAVATRVQ